MEDKLDLLVQDQEICNVNSNVEGYLKALASSQF